MKTTESDFIYFKARVLFWVSRFGLTDWEIHFFHEEDSYGLANLRTSTKDMRADFYLNPDWGDDIISKKALNHVALHEILELMLTEIEELGDARYLKKGEIRTAVHKVINRVIGGMEKQYGI